MANASEFENKLRVYVSRHNGKTGDNWKVSREDGGKFSLWAAEGATTVQPTGPRKTTNAEVNDALLLQKSVTLPPEPEPVIEHPTKEEFLAYVLTFKPGQEYTFASTYAQRFEQFVDWLLEIPGEPFGYDEDEKTNTLKIKREG